MEDGAVRCEKIANSNIIKLFAVIGLKCKNGATELGGDIGVKGRECGESIGFATKRKSPHIMRIII
jgi:hypothetical protein